KRASGCAKRSCLCRSLRPLSVTAPSLSPGARWNSAARSRRSLVRSRRFHAEPWPRLLSCDEAGRAMEDPELAAIRAKKLRDLMAGAAPKPPPPEWSGPVLVTDLTFDSEVRQPGLILVDFWAEWCGPCHRVAPILEQVTKARASRMRLGKLNIDEDPRTPTQIGRAHVRTPL